MQSAKDKVFVNMGHFLAFDPSNNRRNQNFEKKDPSADIVILHMCTMNKNKKSNDI